jgi:hypothetical protein
LAKVNPRRPAPLDCSGRRKCLLDDRRQLAARRAYQEKPLRAASIILFGETTSNSKQRALQIIKLADQANKEF